MFLRVFALKSYHATVMTYVRKQSYVAFLEMAVASHTCKKGYTHRKSYLRTLKNGSRIRVPGGCIRSTTVYNSPVSSNHTRLRGYRKSARTLKSCPSGYIKRASYVRYTKRGKHVLVPEQCIPDVGSPGKGYAGDGPGIGKLRSGELAKYGYTDVQKLSESARHAALARAIEEFGSLGVWRKLNAVQVYTRRTSPAASMLFKRDMDWIRRVYGLKAF
jgi:hypothetical protein